jgi:hypothetical protein
MHHVAADDASKNDYQANGEKHEVSPGNEKHWSPPAPMPFSIGIMTVELNRTPEGWEPVGDALLRGLNHALSNRVGTIGGVAAMLTPGDTTSPPLVAALQSEAERLDELLRLYRALPMPIERGAEPVHVPDVVASAVKLHAHHAELRHVPVRVVADPEALPVRVAPHALLRAVLLLLADASARLDGAHGDDARGDAGVTVRIGGDAQRTTIAVLTGEHGDAPLEPSTNRSAAVAVAAAMLADAGGDARELSGRGAWALEVSLPVLGRFGGQR